jgi:tetratricopeptide (TPR) repeat protein
VTDTAAAAGDWTAVVHAYQTALKGRREGDDLGMLLQIAMVLWRHLNDLEQAEEYFRRIRKIDPAHPAALDFYRAYYTAKGESGKLIALLKQVEKAPAARSRSESGEKSISIEIAELAEAQNNPEKAIEAWKQHLRQDASSVQARAALARLYKRTEKWNALLDLMTSRPRTTPASRIPTSAARFWKPILSAEWAPDLPVAHTGHEPRLFGNETRVAVTGGAVRHGSESHRYLSAAVATRHCRVERCARHRRAIGPWA